MISVQEFNKQFTERHDFQYEDVDFLPTTYRRILFNNIPQAWVYPIFESLSKIKDIGNIISVSQIFGFPVFRYKKNISENDINIVKKLENELLCVDMDLHKQLDVSVTQSIN